MDWSMKIKWNIQHALEKEQMQFSASSISGPTTSTEILNKISQKHEMLVLGWKSLPRIIRYEMIT